MDKQPGVYQITNDEGQVCFVNTVTKGKKTYGSDWADVCESSISGKILKGTIQNYQYRSHEGEVIDKNPTGFLIKINNSIEAFLPYGLCSRYRSSDASYDGETVAVMVDSFDPNSLSIVVKEIAITDQNIDINLINNALYLIGKAHENGQYISGTIIAEQKNWAKNEYKRKRSGYIVTIDGIEAFLPAALTYFDYTPIEHLIGTNVLAGVEEINVEKMSIILSMKTPYLKLVHTKPIPEIDIQTRGIVSQVTPYSIYVLLPQNVIGRIPTKMHPGTNYCDQLKLTGKLINCIPFRVINWDENNDDKSMLVNTNLKGIINGYK